MPGYLLDPTSTVMCPHGGPASTVPSQPRVKVMGQPVLVQPDTTTVAGCAFTVPPGTPSPCVTVRWLTAAVRVKAMGSPVLLQDSASLCSAATQAPQGPATISVVQPRVKGM